MNYYPQPNRYIDTAYVKSRISPVEFYTYERQEVVSKGKGPWKQAGLCPFHADRHAGSFYINSSNGAFRCFACDTRGGDIIAYVQKKYDMPFREVVKKLANDWRVL